MRDQTPNLSLFSEHHTTRLPRTLMAVQGESMSSCISSSEITMATKCNSGSNKWWLAIRKNSVPQQATGSQTLVSGCLGEHHTARPPRHLIAVGLGIRGSWEAQVLFPLGIRFCYWIFCFHIVKPLMPMLALLPNLCIMGKLDRVQNDLADLLCSGSFHFILV